VREQWRSRSSFFRFPRFALYLYRAAYTRGPRLDNTWRENVFGAVAVDVVRSLGSIGSIDATRNARERERNGRGREGERERERESLGRLVSPRRGRPETASAIPPLRDRPLYTHMHTLIRARACTRATASSAWQKGKTKFILRTDSRGSLDFSSVPCAQLSRSNAIFEFSSNFLYLGKFST